MGFGFFAPRWWECYVRRISAQDYRSMGSGQSLCQLSPLQNDGSRTIPPDPGTLCRDIRWDPHGDRMGLVGISCDLMGSFVSLRDSGR